MSYKGLRKLPALLTLGVVFNLPSKFMSSLIILINFDNFYTFLKNRNVFAAIDVFPQEPFPKDHKLRKLKNVVFSPHRAGALDEVFKEMGEIVIKDIRLIAKKLQPNNCKKAELKTVKKIMRIKIFQ